MDPPIERLIPLFKSLEPPERDDAARVLALARSHPEHVESPRQELNRLSELLGRRSARGVPFAVLARALLADLAGSERDAQRLLIECEQRAELLGY